MNLKNETKEYLAERMLQFECVCGSTFLPEYKRGYEGEIIRLVSHPDMLNSYFDSNPSRLFFRCYNCNRIFGVEFKQHPDYVRSET